MEPEADPPPGVETELRAIISRDGPIGVDAYMAAANAHYYAEADAIGASGDFITAPEISQMFGELAGLWVADLWDRAGQPPQPCYADLGPGRGTMAADARRAMARTGLAPRIALVETSAKLRAAQARLLPDAHWHARIDELPADRALLVTANEFFDALPIVQLDGDGRPLKVAWDGRRFVRSGPEVETEKSPAAQTIVASLAGRIAAQGGAALIVDYGHARPRIGDTLQAVSRHRTADPWVAPGTQDLTAHVDFAALKAAAAKSGVAVFGPVTQGDWLRAMGIESRAAQLIAAAPEQADAIRAAVERLTGSEQMGRLFKVMALVHPDWPHPAGFPAPVAWRTARSDDAAALAELGRRTFVETFGHLYRPDDLAAFLASHSEENWRRELGDPDFAVRLGEAHGEAVAYAKIGPPSLPFDPEPRSIELRQFYIRREWQGSATADTMMAWVLDEAMARGGGALFLSVFVDNARARRFYERYGFHYVGKYHFMVGNHADDDLIMRRPLTR